jgi:hypothetical protein
MPIMAQLSTDQQTTAFEPLTAGRYFRVTLWYILGMIGLWVVGIESIYENPTPFYALYQPAFTSILVPASALCAMSLSYLLLARLFPEFFRGYPKRGVWTCLVVAGTIALIAAGIRWQNGNGLSEHWLALRSHLIAVAIATLGIGSGLRSLMELQWLSRTPSPRQTAWLLLGIMIFAVLFAAAIAMMRSGVDGITVAYERHDHEFAGDIGSGGSMHGLFSKFTELHPHLAMHSKVYPPGPIVLLWWMSYVVGRSALALSIGTMVFAVLAIIPLYHWTRDMTCHRTAITASFLYTVVPSLVIFTATSANILFPPFTIGTLFFFWRAIERRSVGYAIAAGLGYAAMTFLSFSLIGVGAFFGIVGLWRMRDPANRPAVVKTALVMVLALLALHGAVRLWSGYDYILNFQMAKAQFDIDQVLTDQAFPRYPAWTFKIWNPLCWFFFAGIPVSLLFIQRLLRPEPKTKALFLVFALTLLALNILYLARGEGERSAMYVLPFVLVPAAHMLEVTVRRTQSLGPLMAACAFLAFQCWLIESYFFTYW